MVVLVSIVGGWVALAVGLYGLRRAAELAINLVWRRRRVRNVDRTPAAGQGDLT